VLNLVGEVPQGAHRDRFFWRILRVGIDLSLVGHDHLTVGLGAQSASLKERLGVPRALLINVVSGLNIVDGINHEIKLFPEFIVEDVFCVISHSGLVSLDVEAGVHLLGDGGSSHGLSLAYVSLAEQELSVEVADFNVVVVSHSDVSFTASNSHEGKGFDVLASESTCTDHESINFSQLLLYFTSVDSNLVIVSSSHRSAVNNTVRNTLKNVVMDPLLNWLVLASELDHFLGNDTNVEGSHRRDAALAEIEQVG